MGIDIDIEEVELKDSDFNLDFLSEKAPLVKKLSKNNYKVLIVDDEADVHESSKMILKNFIFEGRGLEFIDTYNSKEAMHALDEHSDIALVLLDVVMGENDAGLKVVDYIRNTLKNMFIRIILRTGQPGQAPEEGIIVDYDINDYLLKTDITVQRLFTSLYQAFRSYRDMQYIEKNRRGLEKIIRSSSKMFLQESIQEFFNCILNELLDFRDENSSVCFREKEFGNGFVYFESFNLGVIIAATGEYNKYIGRQIKEIKELEGIYSYINNMNKQDSAELIEVENGFLIWKKSPNNVVSYIFIENRDKNYDLELIKIFLTNYSLALDNYIISKQVMDTQVEIIKTLGDAIEKRSHETANHVKRVSEITSFIGNKMGFTQEACGILKITSMMHDVGKIGILDDILMKPGKLSDEEYEIVKTHSEIGYKIFYKSELELLRQAAIICRYHHEKYDGSGYPTGLVGEEIPIFVRIISIVDVFDAITHKRCYKEAWSIQEGVEYLQNQRNLYFDPNIIEIFINNLDEVLGISNRYPD